MALPKSLIAEYKPAQASDIPSPVIFQKTVRWEGAKVGHYRVHPGDKLTHINTTHHVFVPLSGSIFIEGVDGDQKMNVYRTVGEVSITPAGSSYSAHWDEELEYVSVSLTQDFMARTTIDFEANRNARIILACGSQDELIRSIARALAAEIDSGQPAGRIYAESLVNTLAVHLLRHYSSESIVPDLHFGGLSPHKLRRVTEFIDENLGSDLSLAEIAQAADLSPYHFARSFKQTTGLTPIQFLMQRRIEYAKRLLIKSDLPIVEIGLSAGFKNQSHFTTLFRKFTAMTPKTYRNAINR